MCRFGDPYRISLDAPSLIPYSQGTLGASPTHRPLYKNRWSCRKEETMTDADRKVTFRLQHLNKTIAGVMILVMAIVMVMVHFSNVVLSFWFVVVSTLLLLMASMAVSIPIWYSTSLTISRDGAEFHSFFNNVKTRWDAVEGFEKRHGYRSTVWGLSVIVPGKKKSGHIDGTFIPLEKFESLWRSHAWRTGRVGQAITRHAPEPVCRMLKELPESTKKERWGTVAGTVFVILLGIGVLWAKVDDHRISVPSLPQPTPQKMPDNMTDLEMTEPSLVQTSRWCEQGPSPGPILFFTENNFGSGVAGRIHRLQENEVCRLFGRRKGGLSNVAVGDQIVFADHNTNEIYRIADKGRPEEITQADFANVLYRHDNYVRDVAYDPEGRLYFSGDNDIYRLERGKPITVYNSQESAGFGSFAFDPAGTLYLSSGNFVPGWIARVVDGKQQDVCQFEESITGISFESIDTLIYANFENNLVRVHLPTCRTEVIYTAPGKNRIWDVAVYNPPSP